MASRTSRRWISKRPAIWATSSSFWAIAHRREDGVDVRVHPTMIPTNHQLATVNGVFNAIYVVGDFVGETMFFGEGAGAGAAASAVMGRRA